MFKKLGFINWVMFIFNAVAGLLLLLSYAATWVDPRTLWFVAFCGLAYPGLVLVNLLFLIFWALKLHRLVIISILCLLLGWNQHAKVVRFGGEEGKGKKSPNAIRVMTWNAHFFQPFSGNYDVEFKHDMLQVIANENPDVLCLQEFYTRYNGQYNILDSVVKRFKYPYFYFDKAKSSTFSQQGIATFSRYPIVKRDNIIFNSEGSSNRAIYTDIKIKEQVIRVFNIHLQSISFQPEDYKYLKELKTDLEIDNQSAHNIGARLKRAFIRRSAQAMQVQHAVESSPHPVVVAGDFNDTPISFAYATISKGLKNAYLEQGAGYARTYSGAFPNFQIDYVLAGKQFEVLNYRIVKKELSDHFPVRSDLLLH